MSEQTISTHEHLLMEWSFRREMVNYYCNALMLMTPEERDGGQRWQTLSHKLAIAEIGLKQASEQLRGYEEEMRIAQH